MNRDEFFDAIAKHGIGYAVWKDSPKAKEKRKNRIAGGGQSSGSFHLYLEGVPHEVPIENVIAIEAT